MRAQDLQVLVLAIDFDCVNRLVKDGGVDGWLWVPSNDEFFLVRVLIDFIGCKIVQVLETGELLEMRSYLPNECLEILGWLVDALHSILVGDFGPLYGHLDLTSVNHFLRTLLSFLISKNLFY